MQDRSPRAQVAVMPTASFDPQGPQHKCVAGNVFWDQENSIHVTSLAFLAQVHITISEDSVSVSGDIYKHQAFLVLKSSALPALLGPHISPQVSPSSRFLTLIWVFWILQWLANLHNKSISNWTPAITLPRVYLCDFGHRSLSLCHFDSSICSSEESE